MTGKRPSNRNVRIYRAAPKRRQPDRGYATLTGNEVDCPVCGHSVPLRKDGTPKRHNVDGGIMRTRRGDVPCLGGEQQ